MMAAESMPPTPPPVAESFVTVVVEFGLDLTAIWRLPAMVGVVVLAVCCDHSLFCADSLYCANSLLYNLFAQNKLSAQNKLYAQFKVITMNNM